MRRLCLLVVAVVLAGCTAFQRAPAPDPVKPDQPAPPVSAGPVAIRVEGKNAPLFGAIYFSDLVHGWASGAGTTLVTADGGETWRPGSPPDITPVGAPISLPYPAQTYCKVADGLLTVSASQVQRSLDQGKIWTPVLQSPMADGSIGGPGTILCNGDAAWVMFHGGAGMSHGAYLVYRTLDGGRTWAPMLVSGWGTPPELNKLGLPSIDAYPGPFDALDANTAFFLGFCGPCESIGTASITRTTDGGRTWQHDNIAFVRQASALSFVDARHGWITAGARILATADGGKTWHQQYPAGGPGPAQALAMVNERTGFGLGASGDAGALLATHDGGQTWSQIAELPLTGVRQPPEQPSLTLSFPDEQHGWAIPRDGRLLRTTDGGAHWEVAPLPAGKSAVSGVAFSTPVAGCVQVMGADGSLSVYSSSDGGSTWTQAPAVGGAAACAGGVIGQAWRGSPPPGVSGRWSVLDARIDGSAWVTVEGSNKLWATRDSGKTWRQYTWPDDLGLLAVSLSSVGPGQVWAVTVDGHLLRSASADDAVWQVVR
jgi:photosystem II stability/assembly factor-like uncharacterized protein